MEKSTKAFIALIALAVVGSFVMLVYAHISALNHKEYYQSFASHETIFIATLTLALMIVLVIPHIVNKEQIERSIKQEIKNYWKNNYQKSMDQFVSKSDRDYAHISRVIAYLLKQKKNYYWAMAWAGDSVVAYIRCFKVYNENFQLNREYFNFSLNMMKISFNERDKGEFLEKNIDLGFDDSTKNKSFLKKFFSEPLELDDTLMNKIRDKIYEGKRITPRENEIIAVKEVKRVILRYIKWKCIIDIEMQEKLSSDVIALIKRHLDSTFKENFKVMVNNTLKSFYYVNENDDEKVDKEQFIYDIVEKVELEEDKGKVREHLKKIINTDTSSST